MKKLIIGVVVLAIVIIGGLYFTMGKSKQDVLSGNVVAVDNGVDTKVINIDASRFQYSQNVIKVKKGEHVKILINNKDTQHGITIPDLGVSGIDSVEFTADKAGTYEFRCPTMCGKGHKDMKGTLIVE